MKVWKHRDSIAVCTLYVVGGVALLVHNAATRYGGYTPALSLREIATLVEAPQWSEHMAAPDAGRFNASVPLRVDAANPPLNRALSDVDLRRRYPRSEGAKNFLNTTALALERITGLCTLEDDPAAPFPQAQSLDGTIAHAYLAAGRLEAARDFLRAAIREQEDLKVRRYLCGELAWLEEDPAVSAALLNASLTGRPGDSEIGDWPISNAIQLALTTESEDLARTYLRKFCAGTQRTPRPIGRIRREFCYWIRDESRQIQPEIGEPIPYNGSAANP